MSLVNNNLICRCFYTENYFIKRLKLHVRFCGRSQFMQSYRHLFTDDQSDADIKSILDELEEEFNRRYSLHLAAVERQRVIQERYTPLHQHVYQLQEQFLSSEFRQLVENCRVRESNCDNFPDMKLVSGSERVYQMPIFTREFCRQFLEEIEHFEADQSLPKGRPNTMNKYGVLLYELGFDEGLLNPLRECYLSVIAGRLFPDCGGATLDSHRAFVVSYGPEADRDLDLHYDNAEVTVNISLDDEYQEGELYIGRMYTDRQSMPRSSASEFCACQHRLGCGLLHRGQQMHGALPLTAGVRHNLIIWMRSSVTRNHLCPMCQKQPDLVKVSGTGDGFSVSNVDVCSLV